MIVYIVFMKGSHHFHDAPVCVDNSENKKLIEHLRRKVLFTLSYKDRLQIQQSNADIQIHRYNPPSISLSE